VKLTQYTDYSLRVLMYLGFSGGAPATIGEIAGQYGISRNHIVKVVHQLGLLGYIQTIRGKGGGLRLAREPAKIGIGDVVRDMESLDIVECHGPNNRCILSPYCVLSGALKDATAEFLKSLDRLTLADLIAPRRRERRQKLIEALSL
jgi:Rrf2 family nitric oxide-sensitive transcriptional repressor